MTPTNVSKLRTPPEVGAAYYVPCVEYGGFWIPVLGKAHTDPELGQTPLRHWHADIRFMSDEDIRNTDHEPASLVPPDPCRGTVKFALLVVVASKGQHVGKLLRMCYRQMPDYSGRIQADGSVLDWHAGKTLAHVGRIEDALQGQRLTGACKFCPHKGLPLASVPAKGGKVSCPGHGLDFDAVSGVLVRRTVRNRDGEYRFWST